MQESEVKREVGKGGEKRKECNMCGIKKKQ
jgi:hypothetical protein